jgi:multidrug efflux pump subunit AcrA (membrane-fusion protein)
MKISKISYAVLLICVLLAGLVGCSSEEEEPEQAFSTTTVFRGDLTKPITAAGNLALSKTEDVIVDLFYQQGTIAEVLVEVGDSVTKGQVLARIDNDEWQEQIDTLETSLTSAQRNLNTQERALTTAERQVKTKELAYETAEINLTAAEYALESIEEVKEVQDKIDAANARLEYIEAAMYYLDDNEKWDWLQHKKDVEEDLTELQQEKNSVIAGTSTSVSDTVALEIQRKQLNIETALINLDAANDDVAEASLNLEYTEADVEKARENIETITENLEEARSKSPDMTAPFDGFIVDVNVKGGDEVIRGTVAVSVADPDQFQADIYVNETEILDVEIGTGATVIADAIDGMAFPATVTHISPTATISSGVVNYTVRVELTDMEELFSGFEPPEGSEIPEGAEMPEGMDIPDGSSFEFSPEDSGDVLNEMKNTEYDLRDGMSVTVSLIITSETDVLLVPYTAVTTVGPQSFVDVVLENGETEQRQVTVGSTNYTYTAITSGLSEGEIVAIPEGTGYSSSSSHSAAGPFADPGMVSSIEVVEVGRP